MSLYPDLGVAPAYGRKLRRILLVEDDPDQQQELSEFLGANGYDVATANDASQALGCLASVRPRVIIMDIDLPGMCGIRAAEIVTSIDAAQIIIFVSAFPEKAELAASRKGLSVMVMRKPLDPATCLLTLESLFQL